MDRQAETDDILEFKRKAEAEREHEIGLNFTTSEYDKKFSQPKQPANWPDISPATRQGPRFPDVWRIVDVPDTAWREDPCGITCIINWILPQDVVRLDVLSPECVPIVSFQGSTDNVRKHTMQWLALYVPDFTLDHAAYIGAELERADTERIDYVQDGKAEKPYPARKTLRQEAETNKAPYQTACGHCGKEVNCTKQGKYVCQCGCKELGCKPFKALTGE